MSDELPIREFSPDRVLVPQTLGEIWKACEQSEKLAYMLYLKLATRFGSFQKVC